MALVALLLAAASLGAAEQPEPADTKPAVAIVPITGVITDVTHDFIVGSVKDARAKGAEVIVFELDTPGGLVSSAMKICQYIKNLDERTVAWVNPNAYSAGSMIAVACNEIVMAKFSSIGDSAPIMVGPGGVQEIGETERAKQESPILKEFRESAELNGYPKALVEGMVRLGPAIYWIENPATGEKAFVKETELGFYGLEPADIVDKTDKPAEPNASGWRMIRKVHEASELVTLGRKEAIEYGFASRVVNDYGELAEHLGVSEDAIVQYQPTWSERLAAVLSNPVFRGLLLIIILIAGYMELQTPGLGVAGAAALIGLALFLGGPMVAGLASVFDVALVIAGILLLAIELFVIPGFGFMGVAGLLCMFTGIVMSFVGPEPGRPLVPQLPYSLKQLETGVLVVLTSGVISVIIIAVLARFLGTLPLINKLILSTEQQAGGGRAVVSAGVGGTGEPVTDLSVGETGVALGDLRPSGKAEFHQRVYDVNTAGGWIGTGAEVRVAEVTGSRIVVEEV